MPGPLDYLKNIRQQMIDNPPGPEDVKLGMMPLTPSAALTGIGNIVPRAAEAIKGLFSAAPKVAQAAAPAAETLGETMAEFTPRGGEALYNIGRAGLNKVVDPVEAAYTRILSRGGR